MKKKTVNVAVAKIGISICLCFCLCLLSSSAYGSGITVSNVSASEGTGVNKDLINITYDLSADTGSLDASHPAWVFISYILDSTNSTLQYKRPNDAYVTGAAGIVTSTGTGKSITFNWAGAGVSGVAFLNYKIKVHAIEMVLVSSGPFVMGNDSASNEISATVTLPGFYIMRYPITITQYTDFLNEREKDNTFQDTGGTDADFFGSGDGASYSSTYLTAYYKYDSTMSSAQYCGISRSGSAGAYTYAVTASYGAGKHNGDAPMVYISWYNTYAYAKWAGLRLPTDAEWEKTARYLTNTTSRRYSWGSSPEPDRIICNMNSNIGYTTDVNYYEDIWSSLSLATPYGAKEMTGNAWQWVNTIWYTGAYNASNDAPAYNTTSARVGRGGSWASAAGWMRAAARRQYSPWGRDNEVGGRAARSQ